MVEKTKFNALLKDKLLRRLPQEGGTSNPIPGVFLYRRNESTLPTNCLYKPSIIKIIQGRFCTVVDREKWICGENEVLVVAVDQPNTSSILDASPSEPFLSIAIHLDRELITQLAMVMPPATFHKNGSEGEGEPGLGLFIQPAATDLLDAFLRLEAVLDQPTQRAVMAPLILKEIHFRVLSGREGHRLRSLYTYGSPRNGIAKATAWLQEHFREPLRVEMLAEQAHMAASTFHRRFKEVTNISPLQFQKRLRLHEAQRLMMVDELDAAEACAAVGYESLTQFNREYKRHFGEPPRRNVTRWQHEHTSPLNMFSAE